jgi:single-strand DNA-binding protein
VILLGRLAGDPEVRYTQSGKAVCSFTLAVNRFGAKEGQQTVDFVPIVAWERLAESSGNNLVKGQRALVDGRLQIRSYEGNDGQKRRIAEVVAQSIEFLDKPHSSNNSDGGNIDVNSFGKDVFPDEEIPF